jgi:hypothetical protein
LGVHWTIQRTASSSSLVSDLVHIGKLSHVV